MTLTDIAVTTGPITGSTKAYREAPGCEGTKAPFRRVNLAGGEHLDDLHDTSVPSTDPGAVIDLTRGSAARRWNRAHLPLDLVRPRRALARGAETHVNFLPLTPPGQTPLRVMTIAGTDSGGGAGIQADLRTFAMLGVHGCVAVAAVTVQNSVGVKGFHEIPLDVITGQIEAVVDDIGIQAAKTGMLASSEIITAVAETWRTLDTSAPLVVDPVCASMHGDPLLHPSALNALRAELFPLATLVTPNLDEVRLITGIDVVDTRYATRRRAGPARARAQVGAGQGRASAVLATQLPTCCSTVTSSTSSTPSGSTPATITARATRWRPRLRARWHTASPYPTLWPSPSSG